MSNFVPGRTVSVLGQSRLARWRKDNLQRHWLRHPGGKDQACWMDLLKKPSVSEPDYEARSYTVIDEAMLVYDQTTERHGHATYFVDGQRVVSVANQLSSSHPVELRTCYHKHYRGPSRHRSGEDRGKTPVEVVIKYLRLARLEADANREPIRIRKEPLVP